MKAIGHRPHERDLFGEVPEEEPKYPDVPGFKRGGTSEKAANEMRKRAPSLKVQVLSNLILHGPKTPDEMARYMGKTVLSIRPRFTELSNFGLIERTGSVHKNISTKDADVYRATAAAGPWLEQAYPEPRP